MVSDNDGVVSENEGAAPTTPEGTVAVAGTEIPPEKLAELEAKLAEFKAGGGDGSTEQPALAFDPEQYEFDPTLEHLYLRSTLEPTPEGPKWMVVEHQYWFLSGQYHVEDGGTPRIQGGMIVKDKKGRTQYHAKGLDQQVTEIVNGPEGAATRLKGWRLSGIIPQGGMGIGVAILDREVKRALPDPKPITKAEEQPLEKVTDEELAQVQEKAKQWDGRQEGGAL